MRTKFVNLASRHESPIKGTENAACIDVNVKNIEHASVRLKRENQSNCYDLSESNKDHVLEEQMNDMIQKRIDKITYNISKPSSKNLSQKKKNKDERSLINGIQNCNLVDSAVIDT